LLAAVLRKSFCGRIALFGLFSYSFFAIAPPCFADAFTTIVANTSQDLTMEKVNETQHLRSYDDVFTETSARTLLMSARQHLRHHNYLRAIALLKQAVKLDSDDLDVRCLLAQALEEKLSNQQEKNGDDFNLCVQNWLAVARSQGGEEKGMTFKGIGLGVGLFQDEERAILAKRSLKSLTGYLPKPWETNDRYLRRVLKPSSATVSGVIRLPESKGD